MRRAPRPSAPGFGFGFRLGSTMQTCKTMRWGAVLGISEGGLARAEAAVEKGGVAAVLWQCCGHLAAQPVEVAADPVDEQVEGRGQRGGLREERRRERVREQRERRMSKRAVGAEEHGRGRCEVQRLRTQELRRLCGQPGHRHLGALRCGLRPVATAAEDIRHSR